MTSDEQTELEEARAEQQAIIRETRSCVLATVSSSGKPLASYAPVWISDGGAWYVFVSALAKHYGHLRKRKLASAMLIEDEAAAANLFARRRLTVDCTAQLVQRGCPEWNTGIEGLVGRHGETMQYLRKLTDFDLFCLRPQKGRLVLGFGRAYQVKGPQLEEIGYLGTGGHQEKD